MRGKYTSLIKTLAMGDREAPFVLTAVSFDPAEAQVTTGYELVSADSSFNMTQSLQPQLQRAPSDPDTATVRTRDRAFSDLELTPILMRYIPQQIISSFRITVKDESGDVPAPERCNRTNVRAVYIEPALFVLACMSLVAMNNWQPPNFASSAANMMGNLRRGLFALDVLPSTPNDDVHVNISDKSMGNFTQENITWVHLTPEYDNHHIELRKIIKLEGVESYYLESWTHDHPYLNNRIYYTDTIYDYRAHSYTVYWGSRTQTEYGYDYIYIKDAWTGTTLWSNSGRSWPTATVYSNNGIIISMNTDYSITYWGFQCEVYARRDVNPSPTPRPRAYPTPRPRAYPTSAPISLGIERELAAAPASDSTMKNSWQGWYTIGTTSSWGAGKRSSYDDMCLSYIRLEDSSRFVTYRLGQQYQGMTLQQIVSSCGISYSVGNTGDPVWSYGHCRIGEKIDSSGFGSGLSGSLRLGVGDGQSQREDWVLFYIWSNINNDYSGNNVWGVGGEFRFNNGASYGNTKIVGVEGSCPPTLSPTPRPRAHPTPRPIAYPTLSPTQQPGVMTISQENLINQGRVHVEKFGSSSYQIHFPVDVQLHPDKDRITVYEAGSVLEYYSYPNDLLKIPGVNGVASLRVSSQSFEVEVTTTRGDVELANMNLQLIVDTNAYDDGDNDNDKVGSPNEHEHEHEHEPESGGGLSIDMWGLIIGVISIFMVIVGWLYKRYSR